MGVLWRSGTLTTAKAAGTRLRISARKVKTALLRAAGYLFLTLSAACFALPFIWLISSSLKSDRQLFVFPPIWIPNPIEWDNYPKALTAMSFVRYLENTLWICVWNVIGILVSCTLVAYGLSRVEWRGRDIMFGLVLSTMMLPYAVTMIPLYLVFKALGWIGSMKPLIVPAFFGAPFFIFLLRQFLMTIPVELTDAATVDGCSHLSILTMILVPLVRPALATVALFTFMANWNDFMGPLIYLSNSSNYTLAIALQQFLQQHHENWSYLMAASATFTVPIVILFFFTQRTFIQGITLTGIKG